VTHQECLRFRYIAEFQEVEEKSRPAAQEEDRKRTGGNPGFRPRKLSKTKMAL
jgi:hypothetical protein